MRRVCVVAALVIFGAIGVVTPHGGRRPVPRIDVGTAIHVERVAVTP